MEKTKKIPKGLIVAGVVLAVLIVLYLVITAVSKSNQEKQEIIEQLQTTVTGISVPMTMQCSDDQGNVLSFVSGSENGWTTKEYPTYPLRQAVVTKAANYFCDLEAVRVLEEPSALSEYGLEHPLYTIRINEGNADSAVINVGIAGTLGRYVNVEGNDKVYVVSPEITDFILTDIYDVLNFDDKQPFLQTEVVSVTMHYNNSEYVYRLDQQAKTCAATKDGKPIDVSYEAVIASIKILDELDALGCVDYEATDAVLAEHGFNEEQLMDLTLDIYHASEDLNYTIKADFGGLDETGNYRYAVYNDNNQLLYVNAVGPNNFIYNVTTEGLTEFAGGITPMDLLDPGLFTD